MFKALFCILYFWGGGGGGVGMQLLLVIGSDSYSDGGKNVAYYKCVRFLLSFVLIILNSLTCTL